MSHLNLGLIQQELGNLNNAKECFQKSLKLDPNLTYARDNLDILLNQIKLLEISGIENKKDNTDLIKLKTFEKILLFLLENLTLI